MGKHMTMNVDESAGLLHPKRDDEYSRHEPGRGGGVGGVLDWSVLQPPLYEYST